MPAVQALHWLVNIGSGALRRFVVDHTPIPAVQDLARIINTMDKYAGEILSSRQDALKNGAFKTEKARDILTHLLQWNEQAPSGDKIPDNQVRGQVNALIFAGSDTTSTSTTRCLEQMAYHPEIQEKVRHEIIAARAKLSPDQEFTYDELNELPYLDTVVREVLRLHPPVTTRVRIALQDAVVPLLYPVTGVDGRLIQELFVPKGTWIHCAQRGVNRDLRTWGLDGREFKPERWLDLPQSVAVAKVPGVLSNVMTFFGGPRSCMGFKFAIYEMKILLATLLTSFSFAPGSRSSTWDLSVVLMPLLDDVPSRPPGLFLAVSRLWLRLWPRDAFWHATLFRTMPILSPISPPPAVLTDSTNVNKANVKPSVVENTVRPPTTPQDPNRPSISIPHDAITDTMAAHLVMSILGHVLFLKNQVPFPVMQLARIPGGKKNLRAARKREDLLIALDTLSSHLCTTFTALSTALALARKDEHTNMENGRVYLAILLGPGISSPRSRVVLGLDGLEVKAWGETVDGSHVRDDEASSDEDEEDEDEDEGSEESDNVSEESDEGRSDSGLSSYEPSPPPDSPGKSPLNSPIPSRSPSPIEFPLPPSRPARPPTPPTHAEQEAVLASVSRLLSRTLAEAGFGLGAPSELSPTQTHILLRAPRCFKHPSWTPRQGASALDSTLTQFLTPPSENVGAKKKRPSGKEVEGVWIRSRLGGAEAQWDEQTEEDEMIWWSWDGKLVGFSDW